MKRIMIVTILIFFQSCLHRDIKNNITELLNKKIIIPENLEAIKGEYIQDSAEIHAPIKKTSHPLFSGILFELCTSPFVRLRDVAQPIFRF